MRATVDKIASIISAHISKDEADAIYLCGGTSCLTGIEKIIQDETGLKTIKPRDPFLVTPTGIAMSCIL